MTLLESRLQFIESCGTELLTFVDYDDVLPPGVIDLMLDVLDKTQEFDGGVIGVTGNEIYIDDSGNSIERLVISNAPFTVAKALEHFHISRPVILRTEVAQSVAKFLRAQDPTLLSRIYVDFTIAFLAGCLGTLAYTEEVTYQYRQHSKNLTKALPHSWMQQATTNLLTFVLQTFGKDAGENLADKLDTDGTDNNA
jgi:hypothetical protein